MKAVCSEEISLAIDLAACTGLRLSDVVRLSWSHVKDDAIVLPTGKSNSRIEALIPFYTELREVLARIPRRSPVILTNSRCKPWTAGGLSDRVRDAKKKVWPKGDKLHFHDLRCTAATKFYTAGLPKREIAEIMGWEEDHVSSIIRRYVSRTAALKERIRKLDQVKK